jgi:hypothetical protein
MNNNLNRGEDYKFLIKKIESDYMRGAALGL